MKTEDINKLSTFLIEGLETNNANGKYINNFFTRYIEERIEEFKDKFGSED